MRTAATMDLTLEIVLPAADVDHARTFYPTLGWRMGADAPGNGDLRVVQLTYQSSAHAVAFGAVDQAAPAEPRSCLQRG